MFTVDEKQLYNYNYRGWSGGAMVLGKLPVPGRPTTRVGGRVVRWCWVNFQCWGVLQFGIQ